MAAREVLKRMVVEAGVRDAGNGLNDGVGGGICGIELVNSWVVYILHTVKRMAYKIFCFHVTRGHLDCWCSWQRLVCSGTCAQ